MYQRPLSIAILAIGGFAAASDALALGFGRIPESIPFGQALDLAVPLRLDAGESVTPACVQAEVHVGEQRLAPGTVLVTLERRDDLRVRIRSAQVVQEPLVAVNLVVGCGSSVSRQFVVFADPPDSRADASRVAVADVPPAPPASLPAGEPVAQPSVPRMQPLAAASNDARPATRKTARKPQAEAVRPRSQAKVQTPAVAARSDAPKRSVVAAAPRLKLEEPEELLKAATATVAAQDAALASAAQAASAAEAAASASEQRLVAMESSLKTLRDEATAHRATMEQMRNRLAQAEDQGRMQSILVGIVALLAALAAWLGWRVHKLQRERQAAWWQGAAEAEAAAADVSVEPSVVTAPVPMVQEVPAVTPVDDTPPPLQRTSVLPPGDLVEESLTRPVSVDELIDLEQQAEFFIVLGEEDAAVDLLMAHLRSSGGTSPLPYLKLLEIYRHRGDREAYERMRKRFSQRFNAVAPEWGADPERGRDLQHYPAVLVALQACWPRPLDAMAELENLLFRKRSGELFELPAYRDVLTLFSVARDLHRMVDQPTPDVDVLLPLSAGNEPTLSAPSSIFDTLSSGSGGPDSVLDDRPTAPVDLDLSEPLLLDDSRAGDLPPVRLSLR